MRKKLAQLLAGALLVTGAVVTGMVAAGTAPSAVAAASDPYNWRNAEIAGGGFVPGIVFNPTERNLIYARTDIGGAYRGDESTQRWKPLRALVPPVRAADVRARVDQVAFRRVEDNAGHEAAAGNLRVAPVVGVRCRGDRRGGGACGDHACHHRCGDEQCPR